MTSRTDMDRDHTLLGELADLGMDLARDAARRAKEVEDASEAAELMLAFERMARGVRLTLSLKHRLARQAQSLAAEARDRRKADLRRLLKPVIRAQTPHLVECFEREQDLDARIDREVLDEAFADLPLPAAVERIRKALGLPAEEPANDPLPPEAYPHPVHPDAGRDPGARAECGGAPAYMTAGGGSPGSRPASGCTGGWVKPSGKLVQP